VPRLRSWSAVKIALVIAIVAVVGVGAYLLMLQVQ
jgi:hypothetical protein